MLAAHTEKLAGSTSWCSHISASGLKEQSHHTCSLLNLLLPAAKSQKQQLKLRQFAVIGPLGAAVPFVRKWN